MLYEPQDGQAEETKSGKRFSPQERNQLRRCRLIAFLSPVAAAAINTGAVVAFHLAGRNLLDMQAGNAIGLVNYALGATGAVVAALWLHPVPQRRLKAATGYAICSIPICMVATIAMILVVAYAPIWPT